MNDILGEDSTDGDAPEGDVTLKINKKFAEKYARKKDQQALAAAKEKGLLDDSSSSSSEDEDDNAEMLTPHVGEKILETLCAIKRKDPRIYDEKKTFFTDDDFTAKKKSEAKPVRFNDFLRTTLLEEGAEAFEKAENEAQRKKGWEQQDVRDELIKAAHADEGGSDDDLFVKVEKGTEKRAAEDAEFDNFDRNTAKDHMQILASKYWQSDAELDKDEQFLRDYILHEQWKDVDNIQDIGDRDSESEHLDAVDDFEREYNFRFEEEGGDKIIGHDRKVLNSVRQKDDKRKVKRKEREERKLEEKVRRAEELKRLKNLKKKEIEDRLRKLKEIAGTKESKIDLDTEFDPETHDKDMSEMLGENYDEEEETLDTKELKKACRDPEDATTTEDNGYEEEDWNDEEWQDEEEEEEHEAWNEKDEGDTTTLKEDAQSTQKTLKPSKTMDYGLQEEDEDDGLWFLCDGCEKGIWPGKQFYECTVCENITLCKKCFRVRIHPANHRFNRSKVPPRCAIPDELINASGLSTHTTATSSTDNGIDIEEAQKTDEDTEIGNQVKQMTDEYLKLDYEDIIGGDLPTRFKYTSVPRRSFGLDAKRILEMDDKELNRLVGIKKITRPYVDVENWKHAEEEEKIDQRRAARRKRERAYAKKNGMTDESTNHATMMRSRKKQKKNIKAAGEDCKSGAAGCGSAPEEAAAAVNDKEGGEKRGEEEKKMKEETGEERSKKKVGKEGGKENWEQGRDKKTKKKMNQKVKKALPSDRAAAYGL